jgi:hypothetical protein
MIAEQPDLMPDAIPDTTTPTRPTTTAATRRERIEWLACMIVASIGLVSCLWVVPYIPTMDGPQHVLSAHIENHYSDPGSLYPEYYRILPQFAGKGFALLFAPLESFLPWRVALRLTLSVVALAFAWGFAFVVLSLDRAKPRRATAMLGFLIALPWSFYMGFFQFVVGTTFGLYTLAFVLRRPPTTNARRAILALMLLVQGVCHVFTAILTGAIVMVLAVYTAPKGQRLREVGSMTLVGVPAASLLVLTLRERNIKVSEQQSFQWAFGDRISEFSRWFVPGPGWRAWLLIALAVAGIVATIAMARRGKATPAERALAWLGLAFLLLTVATPLHIPGWQCFAPRFTVLALVLGLALVRLPERAPPRLARAAMPLLTACCVGSNLVSANLHHALVDGCADALSGLDAPLHFEGPRLPIIIDPICGTPRDPAQGPVPRASLAHNTPLLYLVQHGGIGTKMFNGAPSIHAIEFTGTRRPPRPDPRPLLIAQSTFAETDAKLREAAFTELAADGMPFEGVQMVGGRPEDFDLFTRRGYTTEYQHGSLFIGRFEGCPAELVLPAGAVDHEPVYYEYGLFSRSQLNPEPRSFGLRIVKRDAPVVDGAIHVPLGARPCGEIWLRVFWDADDSKSFTPGDKTCANAHGQGRVRANVSRDPRAPTAIGCALPP